MLNPFGHASPPCARLNSIYPWLTQGRIGVCLLAELRPNYSCISQLQNNHKQVANYMRILGMLTNSRGKHDVIVNTILNSYTDLGSVRQTMVNIQFVLSVPYKGLQTNKISSSQIGTLDRLALSGSIGI